MPTFDTMTKTKIPVKFWLPLHEVEHSAIQQCENVGNHPDAFHHVAIMPDVHAGMGVPIGTVVAMKGRISPSAVGVDIGCGVCAVPTSLLDVDMADVEEIIDRVKGEIPTGFNWNQEPRHDLLPPVGDRIMMPHVHAQYDNAALQVGSLGQGNHFLQVLRNSDSKQVWLMLHSGSRNVGYKIAEHHEGEAERLNFEAPGGPHRVPPSFKLPTLDLSAPEGNSYFMEMNWALEFARANRAEMMRRFREIFEDVTGEEVLEDEQVNIHHNFAAVEEYFGEDVVVHRKGATRAFEGELGIIPGAQDKASFIVRGLGNDESFRSCSHGAGRTMSRSKAKKHLDFDVVKARLDAMGIVHALTSKKDLDEVGEAYKDVERVMECQSDLVDVVVRLEPLGVVKRDDREERN